MAKPQIEHISDFLMQFSFSEATVSLMRWKSREREREHLTLNSVSRIPTLSLHHLFFLLSPKYLVSPIDLLLAHNTFLADVWITTNLCLNFTLKMQKGLLPFNFSWAAYFLVLLKIMDNHSYHSSSTSWEPKCATKNTSHLPHQNSRKWALFIFFLETRKVKLGKWKSCPKS